MQVAALLLAVPVVFASQAPASLSQTPASPQQSAPPATPPLDRQVFRAGIDVVRLDVRATDSSGQPIADLKPEEVEVFDGGVKQPIVLFQHVAASGRTYLEAAQRTIAGEISTNQGAPRGQLYVLVFDQLHITSGGEQKVRVAAEQFLRHRFRPEDRVAIFGLPGPGPALPFTSQLETAIAQLLHVRGELQRTITPGQRDMTTNEAYEILRGNDAVLSRFLTATNGVPDRTGIIPDVSGKSGFGDDQSMRQLIKDHANFVVQTADADARRFLDMMSQLLRTFRGVDGRKTVMLFTEGFHGDNVSREVEDVAAAAAETYSVVYTFDLNRRTENMSPVPTGEDTGAEISSRLEPVGTLAADTNGQLIIDATGHMNEALDSLGATAPDYYVIGFPASSDALAAPHTYRHVSVRVLRPGVRVSTRTGYVASPPPTPADRRRAIETALAAPFDQQSLRVEYTTYVGQSNHPGLQSVAVSLDADLPVDRAPGGGIADVVFVVRDVATGRVAANGADQISLPHQAAPGSASGVGAWRARFDLPAGDYLMRCVVREPGGLVGSADRQFAVRSLSGPDSATSDLILGTPGDRLPVRSTGYTDELLGGAVRAYGRSEAQLAGLSATLDLLSLAASSEGTDPQPARVVSGVVTDSHSSDQGVVRDISFTVPLADLPAGEYVAHVVVRAAGEVVGDLRRQLEVISGSRPAPAAAPHLAEAGQPALAGSTTASANSAALAAPPAREVLRGSIVKAMVDKASASDVSSVRKAAGEAESGRWSSVSTALTTAPADDPDAARLRALARLDRGDYAGAATDLEQLFNAQPTDARVAFVLGWARIGVGNQVKAVSAFRSAAFLDPTLVPAHLALAETYVRLNQPELAKQALEAGLTALPQSVELRRMLDTLKK